MKTLDEIPPSWSITISGAARFQVVMGGGGVLDKETGLAWEQEPAPNSANDWGGFEHYCLRKLVGGRLGWRAPTADELSTLYLGGAAPPYLPAGHPFTVVSGKYWTQTEYQGIPSLAYTVDFTSPGAVLVPTDKTTSSAGWWCVRGGNGPR